MKILTTCLLCFTIVCNTMSQEVTKSININQVRLYKDFSTGGYTTAGAYTHFDDMEKQGVLQINLSDEDVSKLEEIINRAEKKKHRQQKMGTQNLFCEMQYSGTSTYNRLIVSGVTTIYNFIGKTKGEAAIISDLTSMQEYVIKDRVDLEWVASFQEKMRL